MKKNVLIISLLLLACFSSRATTHIITTQNFSFSPPSINVTLGDTVKWIWVSGTHTTSSMTVPAGAAAWNAPLNNTTTSFTYVPTVTGTYNYVCNFHPTMMGMFTVAGCPPVSGQISASGPTTFCKPGSVTLNAFVTAGAVIQWQRNGSNILTGGTGSSYVAKTSGNYRVIVSNNCGSTFTTNVIKVTANPLPTAVIAGNDTVFKCAADSVTLNATTTGTVTYQWFKNGTAIAGATGPTHKTKAAGSYKVTVTYTATGCSKTSKITRVINNCRLDNAMSEEDQLLTVYPNPSTGIVNVRYQTDAAKATLEIANAAGQVYMIEQITSTGNEIDKTINCGSLPSGIYSVSIKTDKEVKRTLMIKQ